MQEFICAAGSMGKKYALAAKGAPSGTAKRPVFSDVLLRASGSYLAGSGRTTATRCCRARLE